MPKTLNPAAATALRNLDRRLRREIEKHGPMMIWLGEGEFPREAFRGLSVGAGRNHLSKWLGLDSSRTAKRKGVFRLSRNGNGVETMPSNSEKYTEMAIDLTVPLALAGTFSERVEARKAIAAALEAVEGETASRAISAGENAVHLPKLGEGEGWCQMAVDAACETRNQYSAAIRREFGIAEKEKHG